MPESIPLLTPDITNNIPTTEYTPVLERDPITRQLVYDLTGIHASKCRSCGSTVYWVTSPQGKPLPANRQGISHFTDCPNATTHNLERKGFTL